MPTTSRPVTLRNTLRITGTFTPATQERDEDKWDHFATVVTLKYDGRSESFTWRMGLAHDPNKVDTRDVLHNLMFDVSTLDQDFEDWARDLGYDPDSRKAEAIYEAVKRISAQLRGLFLTDFDVVKKEVESWDM